ncbi:ATP-dependent nuclease [Reichenbachiella versicolor]|uniref:ATP-dependent nuclease n=1 Tax=Reichenbachiella versicolor TaxID=1821036 RepID=UPI000D6E152B|nr:AAA family ATPase [Reichenbachiella versicolor]
MYISKLKIKNYRNFKEFEIYLKPLTLIIGENNVGKSNLLDAIGLIFSQDVSFFKKRSLEASDFNTDVVKQLKQQILDTGCAPDQIEYPTIKVEATLKDWTGEQSSVIGDWMCAQSESGTFSEAKLTYTFSPVSNFNSVEEVTQQREFITKFIADKGQTTFDNLGDNEKLNLINFPISKYYYSITGGEEGGSHASNYHLNQLKFELLDALRDAKRELSASSSGRLLFRVLNSKEENEYQELKAELANLQSAIDNNPALQEIKTGISTQLDKISLETENENNLVDFLFSMPNVSDLLKKLSLMYGTGATLIDYNGTGRNNLLFISLMLSYLEDNNLSKKVYWRVVGIEEPEAHLHPNLQNHLAQNFENLMKNEGAEEDRKDLQVVITSHSTYITTKIDFDNTVALYRNGDKVETHYILGGFANEKAKELKYLKKYFDAINTNMFYSRKILLVEGISEQLVIPVLHKLHFGKTIEAKSTCLINVNGLAFRNFLEIVRNGFFQKCLVLTDSDTGTKTENRAEDLINDYNDVDVIEIQKTVLSTFEKDLIEVNKEGIGAECLKLVVQKVRPNSGKAYVESLNDGDLIDVEAFFGLIEKHKSSFAYELMITLDSGEYEDFAVPQYIINGFEFLEQPKSSTDA